MKIDLHTHSNKSDGILSPKELVHLAKNQGVDILALTDHDTVAGVAEAVEEGKNINLRVIPGIELSTQYRESTVHVLGYFTDESYKDENLINFLKDLELHRISRGKKIVENLKTYFDIDLDFEKVLKESKGVLARPHIAKAIIDAGYNYTFDKIFDKLLGNNSPAYVPNKKVSTLEGINLLKKYGCVTSFAHPVLIKKHYLEEIANLPFDCLEGFYYKNSSGDERRFINLSKKSNKGLTCGSDFHGHGKGDTKHGYVGCMNVPLEYISSFLEMLNK